MQASSIPALGLSLPSQMPERIRQLPRSAEGYPVPFFTSWRDGEPEFGIVCERKREAARLRKVCWICGDHLGVYKCFMVGPARALSRSSIDPPSHLQCAAFSAVACPFMLNPAPKPTGEEELDPPGSLRDPNPGVTVLWSTKSFETKPMGPSKLFLLGPPTALAWYKQGRAATLAEVSASVADVVPLLQERAEREGEHALRDLVAAVQQIMPMMPRAEPEIVA